MEQEQTKTIIVTVISVVVANWAMVAPVLKFVIINAWEKSIQWRDMVNDVTAIKKDLEVLKKDVTAAHIKIRDMQKWIELQSKN